MKLHERTMHVQRATAALKLALIKFQDEHELTDVETLGMLQGYQQLIIKRLLHTERQSDDGPSGGTRASRTTVAIDSTPEPPKISPKQRSAQTSRAAHLSWAYTDNPTARTAPARAAADARFEKQVDPDGVLDPVERARRAESARKAFYREIGIRSAQSRARKAQP